MKRPDPYQFDVQQCLALICQGKVTVDCGYVPNQPAKNHVVPLATVVPDLLLQDVDAGLLLEPSELEYREEEDSVIGIGGFGKVYRGKCRGRFVAIKKYWSRDEAQGELRKEAMFLQQLHHPCVVSLIGVSIFPSMALVLEEALFGSLERPLIKLRQKIHRLVLHRIAAQVAAALRHIHSCGIVYRGIKASNVLLWSLDPESLLHCKLCDLGEAARLSSVGIRGITGAKGFVAPEVLHVNENKEHSIYNHKSDIFSFGVLLYQMISSRHPYHDVSPVKIDRLIQSGVRPQWRDVPQADSTYFYLARLMQRCWHGDPHVRPTTSQIIEQLSLSSFQSVMTIKLANCLCVMPVSLRPRTLLKYSPLERASSGCAATGLML